MFSLQWRLTRLILPENGSVIEDNRIWVFEEPSIRIDATERTFRRFCNFINLSAGGSGAISSAGIVSSSAANASSAGASGAISFAGVASGSAA
jgi:hypothetical protein